ncbi:hypothetical protein [Azorhizophilus paspali]|uniref:Uncharacterized protein n=1 Tax=Azorhizophilus paspali TaxID=69963 RepID=A0ABV6SFJ2_AZOPA
MAEHSLFYYPYASLTNEQLPLLKVAALYFDKLIILDPVGASWATVGADHVARDAITLLKGAGILEVVTPADVLAKYAGPVTEAVRRDMADREFLELCDAQVQATGKQRSTLALAKVPQQPQTDQAIRHLMGDFAREVAKDSGHFREHAGGNPGEYYEYAERGQAFDEYREGYGGNVEYRYADFPLALGEAIMMNHACSLASCTLEPRRSPTMRFTARSSPTSSSGSRRSRPFARQSPVARISENSKPEPLPQRHSLTPRSSCPSWPPRCRWLRFSSTGRRTQMPSPRFARCSD